MDFSFEDASQCGTPQQHVPAEVQFDVDTQIAPALSLASAEAQGGVAAECAHVQRALRPQANNIALIGLQCEIRSRLHLGEQLEENSK